MILEGRSAEFQGCGKGAKSDGMVMVTYEICSRTASPSAKPAPANDSAVNLARASS